MPFVLDVCYCVMAINFNNSAKYTKTTVLNTFFYDRCIRLALVLSCVDRDNKP